MKPRSLFTMLTVLVSLFLLQAEGAYAAVTLSLVPSGTNRFVVQASSLEGVAALDFTITYDSNLLASPVAERGSAVGSAMFAANLNKLGSMHIAIMNGTGGSFQGSGPVAVVTFTGTGKGSETGKLGINITSVINAEGQQVASIPVGVDNNTVSPPSGEGSGGATTVGTGQPNWPVGMTVSPDTNPAATPAKERKEEPAMPTAEPVQEPSTPSAPPQQTAPRQPAAEPPPVAAPAKYTMTVAKSVLAKFREYKGERTPKALMDLFKPEEGANYRQQPPVVLSDGVAAVKVRIAVPTAKNAPNFALKDAKLVSLRRDGDAAWAVEAKPVKGTSTATITMLLDGAITEIPVVVAPPADITVVKPGVAPTEAEFSQFLKEKGTDKAPRFDLNKDGKRDYLDDYIFTANYLVLTSKNQAGAKPVTK